MSKTRSTSDKTEVEDRYKSALQNQGKPKPKNDQRYTHTYTSTPIPKTQPEPKQFNLASIGFDLASGGQSEVSDKNRKSDDSFLSGDDTLREVSDIVDETIQELHDIDYKPSNKENPVIIMAHPNPFATLKYAVEAVPFFDGKNIPLTYFIEGCEEAKSMLPPEAEPQFARIIRTRIVGEARRTIQDQDFDSVAQLTKYLENTYGPAKNIYQLQGELGRIYQRNEEDVVTYANRVKFLGKQILEAHKNSGNTTPARDIKISLEKDMCKCFIRGLKPEIEQRIARELDVQATVADALRIEKELNEMTNLRQEGSVSNKTLNVNLLRETCQICYKEGHSASNCRKLTQFSPPTYNTALGAEILICQICKKRGHGADKCRLRDPQNRRPVNTIQGNNSVCQLCSKTGHNAKTCRTNSQNKTSVICQWCDKPGHSANNCWKKQNEQTNSQSKPNVVCQNCNNFGHIARNCQSKNTQNTASKNSLFCRYCKEDGHLLENCKLRIASNNRRKAEEQGNYKGPSTSGVQPGSERISHPSTSQKTQ